MSNPRKNKARRVAKRRGIRVSKPVAPRTYAQAQIDLCLRDLEQALVDGDLDKANLEASSALIAGAQRGKVEDLMVRYGA